MLSQLTSFRAAIPAALAPLLFVTACGGEKTPSEPEDQFTPRVTEVTVTPSSAELTAVGDTQKFEARAEDQRGNRMSGVSFEWRSSRPSVARVDSTGTAVGQESGSTTISARASGVADTASLRVDQEVASLDVSPDSAVLNGKGDTVRFTATARDANANEVPSAGISWSSTDTTVARVDSTGLTTAREEGTARVVASVSAAADSARARVEASRRSPSLPASVNQSLPARFYAASAWDPLEQRVLVHGGSDRRTHGELFAYDPSSGSWRRLAEGPRRWGHQAVFDSVSGRLFVFGGNDGSQGFAMTNDIWSYDPGTGDWNELDPAGSAPDPREQASVAVAEDRRRVFVFGGQVGNKTDVVNDLWVYHIDDNEWEPLHPSGSTPEARKGASIVWDGEDGRLLLYGGWNSVDPRHEDLWAYDAEENRWQEISTGGEPPRRYRHGAAWVPESRQMYVYAGCCGPHGKKKDLWRYDAESERWTEVTAGSPAPSGRNRLNDQMLWDPVHEALLVYAGRGGCSLLNDLWAWVPRQDRWIRLSQRAEGTPLRRVDHAATSIDGFVYSSGGCDGSRQTNTLARFDPETGEAVTLNPSGRQPPARSKHGLVADSARGKLYLYGGSGTDQSALGDLWAYDVQENEWAERTPSGSAPTGRYDPAWVWNPDAGTVLLFGGVNPTTGDSKSERFRNDLWRYDPASDSWTELQPDGTEDGPEPRKHQMGVWDTEGDRLLIYGGHAQRDDGSKINYTDLWAYDPTTETWTLLNDGSSGPEHRVDTGAAWHRGAGQVLLYGGMNFSGPDAERRLGDLWSYSPPSDTWEELSSDEPEARQQHELVRHRNSILLIGGYGSPRGKYLGTVWSYSTSTDDWERIR